MPEGWNREVKNMQKSYRIPILAVLLVLAAGVCAVSAVQLNVGSVTLANDGSTADITLALDSAPTGGLAGYSLTFTIADPTVAQIVGVNFPGWKDSRFVSSSTGTNNWNMMVADVQRQSGPSPSLGSVTVQGLAAAAGKSTTLTVTVNEMDGMDGNPPATLTVVGGTISVAQPPGSILVSSTPAGAEIFVDGNDMHVQTVQGGSTTINGLTPQTHEVRVKLAGYVDGVQQVPVPSGGTYTVTFTLQLPVTINLKTTPAGCNVYFTFGSGSEVSKGPTDATTGTATYTGNPPGTYTVRVDKTGYLGKSLTRTLSQGATSTFTFTLSPAKNDIPQGTNPTPYGFIHVSSEDVNHKSISGATVVVDGVPDLDLQTPATKQLDKGSHTVTVALEGYLTISDPWKGTITSGDDKVLDPFVLKLSVPVKKVYILPRVLNIGRGDGKFLAIVRLPDAYKAADVDPKSVFCNWAPADKLIRTKAFPQIFVAIFTRKNLVGVLPENSVKFTVSGKITTMAGPVGFSGSDSIKVIKLSSKAKEDTDDVDKMIDDTIMKNFMPKGF